MLYDRQNDRQSDETDQDCQKQIADNMKRLPRKPKRHAEQLKDGKQSGKAKKRGF